MDCIICLNPITNKCTLDCNHSFCFTCIDKWQNTRNLTYGGGCKNNCPICRRKSTINKSNIRITRSMSLQKRNDDIQKKLIDLCETALSGNGNNKEAITKILQLIYENPWYIKHHEHSENCNCGVAKQIKLKLDEYEACGWKEASIWKIKMRNIL